MQRREKILAIALTVVVLGWGGFGLVERVVFGPFKERASRKTALAANIEKQEDEQLRVLRAERQLKDWVARSLPPDPVAAQRLYLAWLTDLCQVCGFSSPSLSPERRVAPNKVYVSVRVTIEATATFPQICNFLYQFRRTDLLHRIADLTLQAEGTSPTSPIKVTLIAEGLSLKEAPPRDYLFPRTELAAAAQTSDNLLKVAETKNFPAKGEFHVRAGSELLIVQSTEENAWTVVRGVDGTTASSHAQGTAVELVPIFSGMKDRKFEDLAQVSKNNPFAKPEKPRPPDPPPKREEPKKEVALDDPAAKTTKLIGLTALNNDRQACLYDATADKRTIVKEGQKFDVAKIRGTVVTIDPKFIVVRIDEATWQLDLGKDLASMKKLGKSGGSSATGESAQPSAGDSEPKGEPAPVEAEKPAATAGAADKPEEKPAAAAASGDPTPAGNGDEPAATSPEPAAAPSAPAVDSDAGSDPQPADAAPGDTPADTPSDAK